MKTNKLSNIKCIEDRHFKATEKVNKLISNRIKTFLGPYYLKNYSIKRRMLDDYEEHRKNIDKALFLDIQKDAEYTKSNFIFKMYTNTNEYTFYLTNYIEKNNVDVIESGSQFPGTIGICFDKFLADSYYDNLTMELKVESRTIRAGEPNRNSNSLGEFQFTYTGWSEAQTAMLKYEVLDSIKDKWKKFVV